MVDQDERREGRISAEDAKTCVIAERCPDRPLSVEPALAGCGFQCHDCPTGTEPSQCDLLLLHLDAADKGGQDTLKALSKTQSAKNLVVVYEEDASVLPELFVSLAKAKGADRVLRGPLTDQRLSKTLEELGLSD